MQWNDDQNAGFSSAAPWLAVNENHKTLHIDEQEKRPDSVLNYFRSMIRLRKNNLTLIYGSFELVDENNKQLFAYSRQLENEKLLVVLNFSNKPAGLNTVLEFDKNAFLISNYEQPFQNDMLKPYAAVIYNVEN